MTEPHVQPWIVRMHYRMRSVSFAALFLATALHIMGHDFPPWAWALLVLLLLLYPQLQYWRSSRSATPIQTEFNNLLIDSILLGIYMAALGFPLWLSFSAGSATLTNNTVHKGWRGTLEALLALALGAVLCGTLAGWRFLPQTDWHTTLVCMLGLVAYLLAITHGGFVRNFQLRRMRENLRLRETELLQVNQTLTRKLDEIDKLQQRLSEQANHDALTGLYNRRYLDGTLERELARCKREGQPIALIMIDVDHFKKYNDLYGHQAGDECLCKVGQAIQDCAKRASDLAARFGGEEFVLVLPDANTLKAQQLSEGLRQSVEALGITHAHSRLGRITVSIGIAVMDKDDYKGANVFLRAADEALYHAKHGGRNQVRLASETPYPEGFDGGSKANFAQLVWHTAYECGQAEIDEQHKTLFKEANRLHSALLADRPASELQSLLETVIGAVAQHFRDEEALLWRSGFPTTQEHATNHNELIDQARRLVARFLVKDIDADELFQYLAHDLIARHILRADREFFLYLRELA